MKITIVQEQVDTSRGGAETSTVEMARHLAALGLNVHVVCRADNSTPFVDQNVTFLPIGTTGRGRALQTYQFIQGVHRLCRVEDFDIVHAVTPCLSATVYQPRGGTYVETVRRTLARVRPAPWRWAKGLGRRFNVRQRFLARIERLLLTKYQHRVFVAALSEYVRRQVLEQFDFPAEQTRVVFNGVEIAPPAEEQRERWRAECRRSVGLSAEQPLLLFVAHNFKLKGLAELLRALACADREGYGREWTLVVAGRDDTGPPRRLGQQLKLESRVHFVGTDTPVQHWYAAADLLAHPTWYDPCSRVVLEALSVGLPVVTTRLNGAAEVMQVGTHGAIVDDPRDAGTLAVALREALDPGVRAACQASGELRPRLSMARHAQELCGFYEDILHGE